MKNVQIIEKPSGHIVAEYPVIEELINDSSEGEYLDEAWENAVEEELVDDTNRDKYDIEIVGDIHSD